MSPLTSRCRSTDAESQDAFLADCVCPALDVIPVFEIRGSVIISPFQHADLNVALTYAHQQLESTSERGLRTTSPIERCLRDAVPVGY